MREGFDRQSGSAWVRAGLCLLLLCTAERARADVVIQVKLSEQGQDVTKANADARVLFYEDPEAGQKTGSREVVRCGGGSLCVVPPGTYWVDIDSMTLAVETRPLLTVGKEEPQSTLLTLYVTRAATIEIPDARLPVGAYLTAVDEKTGVLHSRKVDGSVAHVRIPGRPVILCGFESDGRPIGCQRVMAKPGETVRLPGFPQPAKGRGQLLVGFVYPAREPPWDVAVALRIGEKKIAPDVVTARFTHFYAIWFDAPAGQGTLELTSKFWTTDSSASIEVPERRTAARMKIPLVRKPTLKVTLLGAASLGAGALDMDLFSCEKHLEFDQAPALPLCSLAASESGIPAQTFVFADLSSSAYALRWKKPPFESATWIDMRDGKSREERLPVELLELGGRVTRRGKGVAARIHWEAYNSGAAYETVADDDGRYSVTVAQKGRHFVRVRGDDGRTFARDFSVGDVQRYDIEIPANQIRMRVVTGQENPVVAARIFYEVLTPPPEERQEDVGQRRTDKEGKATLPPLPPGTLKASISAEGFRPAEIQPLEITEKTEDEEILVRLTTGAGIRLHILDSTGSPAVNARIWTESESSGAMADASGTAVFEEPLSAGAPLVAFDTRGSMGFFRYSGDEEQTVQIPPSGPPILVRFLSPDGKPLDRKNVFVGVGGVLDVRRVLNQALAAGGGPSSLADGSLRVAGLPAEGLLTICPAFRLDLAITRTLPIREEIVFTLPLGM
jgi:hypothetical protein